MSYRSSEAIVFRLVSLNLNGIRSAASKGLVEWVRGLGCDCMGVQEIRAQQPEIDGRFEEIAGMKGYFHFAERRGYSGVGIYSRKATTDASRDGVRQSPEFDAEGRYVEAALRHARARKLSVISCYFPERLEFGPERQLAKFRFLESFYPHMIALKAEREFILVGDINIAHHEIDLKNFKGNRKNSGFLPEERDWMTRCFDPDSRACAWSMFFGR